MRRVLVLTVAFAAALMMTCAAACLIVMEERPLAGPSTPAEMAE